MFFPFDILAFLGGIWSIGYAVLREDLQDESSAYRAAAAFGTGVIVTALFIGLAGLTVGYGSFVFGVLFLILAFVFVFQFRNFRGLFWQGWHVFKKHKLLILPAVMLPGIYFWSSLGPETFVDSLWYHLNVPKYWLLQGRLADVPFNVPSHYPMFSHLPYVVVLWLDDPWHADVHARLYSVFPILPLLFGVYASAARHAGRRAGILAAVLTAGITWWPLPVIANVQFYVALFVFLGYTELWRWFDTRRKRRFFYSVVFMGAACSTKLNAVLFGLVPCFFLLLFQFLKHRDWRKAYLPFLYGVGVVLWLFPWWIANWFRRGNPFYPFLEDVFLSDGLHHQAALVMLENHHIAPLESSSLLNWYREYTGLLQNLVANADVLYCMAPFAFFLLVLVLWRRIYLWAGMLLILIASTFMTGLNAERLLSVTHPVLAVLCSIAIVLLAQKYVRFRWLYFVALLVPLLTTLQSKYYYVINPGIDWHGQVAVCLNAYNQELIAQGTIDPEDLPFAAEIAKLPADTRIFAYRMGYPFHLPHQVIFPDVFFDSVLDVWLEEGGRERVLGELRKLGIDVLLIGSRLERNSPEQIERLTVLLGERPVKRSLYALQDSDDLMRITDVSSRTVQSMP